MLWRSVRLLGACGVLAALAALACGGNASDSPAAAGRAGSGGAGAQESGGRGSVARAGNGGGLSLPPPVACGTETCTGLVTPIPGLVVAPCCADPDTGRCGLDSSGLAMFGASFGAACQPLAQPGTKDSSCPDSPSTPVQGTGFSISLSGCCRPDHTCGYDADKVAGVLNVGLGCISSEPFLGGERPQSCGEVGAGGAGGDSGSGGAGGDSTGIAGAAGESASAGAGG